MGFPSGTAITGPVTARSKQWPALPLGLLFLLAVVYATLRIFQSSAARVDPLFAHDLYKYYYQMYDYAAAQIASGHLPLWNPWQVCGQPFLATHQAGIFYPPNILYLLMPTHIAMGVAFAIHLFLAGIFTYLCAREFGISRYGALIAGITFMFAGHMTYHVGEPSNFYCAAWTPLMLYLTARICRHPSLGSLLALAFFSSIQFMAGFEQHYLYTLFFMFGYVIYYATTKVFQHRKGELLRLTAYLCIAGILTIGLSAVQLLPTSEMAFLSGRSVAPLQYSQLLGLQNIMKLGEGVEINAINFFLSFLNPSPGKWAYNYVGLLPLILLPYAFFNRNQRGHIVFLLCSISICIIVSMVEWGNWLWVLHIPSIAIFRGLHRIMFVSTLCFGLLAGIGWDTFSSRASRCKGISSHRKVISLSLPLILLPILWIIIWETRGGILRSIVVASAISLVLLSLWKPNTRKLSIVKAVLLITVFADLASGSIKPIAFPSNTPTVFHQYDHIWRLLRQHQEHSRVHLQFAALDWDHAGLAEKDGQLEGIRTITDYEPLVSGRIRDYMVGAQNHPFPQDNLFYGYFSHLYPGTLRMKLLNLMATRYFVIFRSDISEDLGPGQRKWWVSPPEGLRLVYEEQGVRIYENPSASPRAFVVHEYRVIANPERVLEELGSEDFDPAVEVLLSEIPVAEAGTVSDAASSLEQKDIVTFLRDEPERVELRIRTDRPGFLVLADSDYPGWNATVNGNRTRIYRANFLFRAVAIDEGENLVNFTYRPASFEYGLWISLGSLVICMAGAIIALFSKRGQVVKALFLAS